MFLQLQVRWWIIVRLTNELGDTREYLVSCVVLKRVLELSIISNKLLSYCVKYAEESLLRWVSLLFLSRLSWDYPERAFLWAGDFSKEVGNFNTRSILPVSKAIFLILSFQGWCVECSLNRLYLVLCDMGLQNVNHRIFKLTVPKINSNLFHIQLCYAPLIPLFAIQLHNLQRYEWN